MTDRKTIAMEAAEGLRRFADDRSNNPVCLGFDGFVDSIIDVVDKRQSVDDYEPIPTIDRFGQKIVDAAGQSGNYELVVKLQKLGGNGPIMANALVAAGLPVTYIGSVGEDQVHPVFEELAAGATVHALCAPGYTDALEFTDGKLMLGKYDHLRQVNIERIDERLGRGAFAGIVNAATLLGMVNWTMLGYMNGIWEALAEDVLSRIDYRQLVFVDLADPEKRTTEDLKAALDLLSRMQRHADVMLGLNLKEAVQVAEVLGVSTGADPEAAIEPIAVGIREKLELDSVVVHPRAGAAAARRQDGKVRSARFDGPFTAHPKLSTGAGDNFNAGFCLGRLAGLPVEQTLCVGTATSGYYVRNAGSPTLEQMIAFCENLPEPEPHG